MGILNKLFKATPIGSVVGSITDIAEKLFGKPTTPEEKAKFAELKIRSEEVLQKRDSEMEITLRAELGAKERVLIAELQQGDKYTKRARPTVVYVGLFMFFFNYSLVRLFGYPQFDLPWQFIAGWSGIVTSWSIGRSTERVGFRNRVTKIATGSEDSVLGL